MDTTVHFRTIIPIYNLDSRNIELSGIYNDANYAITLDFVGQTGKPASSVLNNYVNTTEIAEKIYRSIFFSETSRPKTDKCPILVINVRQELTNELQVGSNSWESIAITSALIKSLSLLTTKGIITDNRYSIRISDMNIGSEYQRPSNFLTTQFPFQQTMPFFHGEQGLSVLDNKYTNDLEKVFNVFLEVDKELNNEDNSAFKQILTLSNSYYQASQCLLNIDHAFLMLVLILEIIYKIDENESFDKATSRCKAVLKLDRHIANNFFNAQGTGLRDLRNLIAHGKLPDTSILKKKYDYLFEIIRHSILHLILKEASYKNKEQKDWYQ